MTARSARRPSVGVVLLAAVVVLVGFAVAPFPQARAATPPSTPALRAAVAHESAARAFVTKLAASYGVDGSASDLRLESVTPLGGGDSAVRFQQLAAGGVPVYGGELVVQLDGHDSLLSVTGETARNVGTLAFDVPSEAARARALSVASGVVTGGAADLVPGPAIAYAYDPTLVQAKGTATRPAWQVVVSGPPASGNVVEVLVDAATGAVLSTVDRSAHLARSICDNRDNASSNIAAGSFCTALDPNGYYLTSIDASHPEAEAAYRDLGEVSDFYQDVLGVDLTQLIGLDTMRPYSQRADPVLTATVNYCETGVRCPYANAFWADAVPSFVPGPGKTYPGGQVYLGRGFASALDVVAHEVSHGVTSATSGLKYQNQSGAINESMSDVFGELASLYHHSTGTFVPSRDPKWLIGERLEAPGVSGAVRSMSNPATTSLIYGDPQPSNMTSRLWDSSGADSGGVHTNSGVGNKTAFLIARGGTFNGVTVRAVGERSTARIYWRTENLLTSGANYRDLAVALASSCNALFGRTSRTCAAVRAATKATEISRSRVQLAMASTVAYGSTRTIRARLVSARGGALYVSSSQGARLVLERRYLGSSRWRWLSSHGVTTAGKTSWTVRPRHSAVFRIRYLGNAPLGLGAASSSHTLKVRR